MNVLFLALGASRRPAVVAESARVVADGGTATVLVDKRSAWVKNPIPDEVEVVELSALARGYRPAVVQLMLYRLPRLLRGCFPGLLRARYDRVESAYRRRVARPIDRGLARLYRRNPAEVRRRVIVRDLLHGRPIDLVVVGDAQSLVTASELRDTFTGAKARLAYTVIHDSE